jgi:hypothetical protein
MHYHEWWMDWQKKENHFELLSEQS